ncbi:hypothetical protein IFM89_007275 [Coptis chinensis]|uniref:Uncharacterized protein n=1 Tax=Coptis chinensis TaxID=261450 RepID=A0A835IN06_9MAGN|nr:hypothetical protein IFM89_007275 [Coptis chinensis]
MNTFSCLETLSVCISESCMGAVWLYFCISEIYVSDVVERDTSRKTAPKKKDGVKVSQSEKTVARCVPFSFVQIVDCQSVNVYSQFELL